MSSMIRSAALLAAWLTVAPAMAGEWQVADSGSRIGFVATYEETAFEAWFRSFDAQIRFDPDAPADASFDIRIDVTSVDSNSPDRDEGMKREEWLAAGRYPEARFIAERVEKLSGNRYQATGPLSLKDTSRILEVPFTWEQSGDDAVLTAETEVQRTGFDIGTGDWAEDDTIGFTVTIKVRLALTRR